jgi:hypothetical protein
MEGLGGNVSFVATRADTDTAVIVASVDWATGSITDSELVRFGVVGPNVCHIDETCDGFVIASARCHCGENNVVIASADGSIIREICYGDGIQCLACFDDKVTVGYIDEGIYGNYGWTNPIGAPGVVRFDLEGNILWSNSEHSISEVYAMTLDETGRVWFYNYSPFTVVCSSYEEGSFYCQSGINGSNHLFATRRGDWVILDGGYHRKDQLYAFQFNEPETKWRIVTKIEEEEVNGHVFGRGSLLVALGSDEALAFLDWTGDEETTPSGATGHPVDPRAERPADGSSSLAPGIVVPPVIFPAVGPE